jgi:DNA helicase-2/ATP-dependent DNA helicase PcrA
MGKLLEMPRPPEPLPGLNREQQQAVLHGDGPLLVVAGAGTGKTRVITQRIRHLLESDPSLPGDAILGLTFTDKAAAEMKHRVVQAVGDRGRMVWLSTFHAFCYQRILGEQNPGLTVVDEYDHWILLRRNLHRLGLRYFRRASEPGQFLGDFCDFFARCQDELVTSDDFDSYVRGLHQNYQREQAALDAEARRARQEEIERWQEVAGAYRASEEILKESNLITFGMQLMGGVRELQQNEALRERFQKEYRYILVDEFQDTNIAQIELLYLLAGEGRNVVAVGDNDQAIYHFRGASFSSFTIFLRRFAGVEPQPGHLGRHFMTLTQNYRSTQRILRVAGQVIGQNEKSRYLPEKRLHTENHPGERISVVECNSPAAEAHWVADELRKLHEKGHAWSEFAVLYRMHVHRNLLVDELERRQIPFVIKNLSILTNPLVRDLIAYLRVVAMPWDNVACARVLAMPAWGVTPEDLVRLAGRTSSRKGVSLWDALEQAQAELPLKPFQKKTAELIDMMRGLRQREKKMMASELLDELTEQLGLALVPEDSERKVLDCFRQFVREWQQKTTTGESRRLREFSEYLEYFEEAGGQINLPEAQRDDAVQLMTVHTAKGLEFDHVFILRLCARAFPTGARRRTFEFPPELMKEELPQGDFHIQEERRLFYVALTRARRQLTLTTVVARHYRASPFLDDFLQEPLIQIQDVRRLTPTVSLPAHRERPTRSPYAFRPQRDLFAPAAPEPRVYSRIADWAESYRAVVFSPLQLSASSIETYQTCPLKYLFEKSWGLRGGPSAAATFGNIMHTVLKHFLEEHKNGGKPEWDDLQRIYQREWRSPGFEDAWQEEQYRQDGLEQLRAFFDTFVVNPPRVLMLERSFDLPMERDVVIKGRIDQVTELSGHGVEIVDYKTGRPRDERQLKRSLQLSIYALAAREVLELDPERITIYSLMNNETSSATPGEKEFKQARDTVAEVAENIRAGSFPAQPGFHCRYCDYKSICPEFEGS